MRLKKVLSIFLALILPVTSGATGPSVNFIPQVGGAVNYDANSAVVLPGGTLANPVISIVTTPPNNSTVSLTTDPNNKKLDVNLFVDNKNTTGTPVNFNIDLPAKFNRANAADYGLSIAADASNVLLLAGFTGNINANLSGYNGLTGKNMSQVCATEILNNTYGATVRNAFLARRVADPALPADRCDTTDVASVSFAVAPSCGVGTHVPSQDGLSNATFGYKMAKKKRKCERSISRNTCDIKTREFKCALGPTIETHAIRVSNGNYLDLEVWRILNFGNGSGNFYGQGNYMSSWQFQLSQHSDIFFLVKSIPIAAFGGTNTIPVPGTYFGLSLTQSGYIGNWNGSTGDPSPWTQEQTKNLFNQKLNLPTPGANSVVFEVPDIAGKVKKNVQVDPSGSIVKTYFVEDIYPGDANASISINRSGIFPLSSDYNLNSVCTGKSLGGSVSNFVLDGARLFSNYQKFVLAYKQTVTLTQVSIDGNQTCQDWLNNSSRPNKSTEYADLVFSGTITTNEFVEEGESCPSGTVDRGLSTDWTSNPSDYLLASGYDEKTCQYGASCGSGVDSSFVTSTKYNTTGRPESGEIGSFGGKLIALTYSSNTAAVVSNVSNGSNGANGSIDMAEAPIYKYCADVKDNTIAFIQRPNIAVERVSFFPWNMRPAAYIENRVLPTRVPSDYTQIYTDISEPFRDFMRRRVCPTCPQ